MWMTLDSLGAQCPHQREARGSESEMEGVVLLIVKIEEGAMSLGCSTSRSWKRPEMILPPPPPRTSPAHTWI